MHSEIFLYAVVCKQSVFGGCSPEIKLADKTVSFVVFSGKDIIMIMKVLVK